MEAVSYNERYHDAKEPEEEEREPHPGKNHGTVLFSRLCLHVYGCVSLGRARALLNCFLRDKLLTSITYWWSVSQM